MPRAKRAQERAQLRQCRLVLVQCCAAAALRRPLVQQCGTRRALDGMLTCRLIAAAQVCIAHTPPMPLLPAESKFWVEKIRLRLHSTERPPGALTVSQARRGLTPSRRVALIMAPSRAGGAHGCRLARASVRHRGANAPMRARSYRALLAITCNFDKNPQTPDSRFRLHIKWRRGR